MTTAEILRAAKALIPDEAHWWRGDGKRPSGRYCPALAIGKAVPLGKSCLGLWFAVDECFIDAIGTPDIPTWSDDRKNTFAQLTAAWDRAIAIAESREAQ